MRASAARHFGGWLGDATVGYSRRTLEVLLEATGFRVLRILHEEKGKVAQSFGQRALSACASLAARISRGHILLTPGLIVVAGHHQTPRA